MDEHIATPYVQLSNGYHLELRYRIANDGTEWGGAVLVKDEPPTLIERVEEHFAITLITALLTGFVPFIITKLKNKYTHTGSRS